ncbi:MAG: hypothetical protein ABI569_15075 [Casimicrobiaceae bacterium]
MMTRRRCAGWMLTATLSLPFGGLLAVTPEECLTYPDNPRIAACANRFGPGSTAPQPRTAPAQALPRTRSVPVALDTELRTVAVIPGGKSRPAPEPEPQRFAVDRAALTNTIIAGAIGGSLLVLVALGFWRWGSTLTKACPYCGTKMSRSAHACRRCFRAV